MCDTCGCNVTHGNEHLVAEGGRFAHTHSGSESVEVGNDGELPSTLKLVCLDRRLQLDVGRTLASGDQGSHTVGAFPDGHAALMLCSARKPEVGEDYPDNDDDTGNQIEW